MIITAASTTAPQFAAETRNPKGQQNIRRIPNLHHQSNFQTGSLTASQSLPGTSPPHLRIPFPAPDPAQTLSTNTQTQTSATTTNGTTTAAQNPNFNNNSTASKQKLSRNPSRESLHSNSKSPPVRVSSHSKHCRRIELLRMKKIKDPIVVSMRKRLATHSSMVDLSNPSLNQTTNAFSESIMGPLIAKKLRTIYHPSTNVFHTEMEQTRTEWSLSLKQGGDPAHQSIPDFKGWTVSTWKSAEMDSNSAVDDNYHGRQSSLFRQGHQRAKNAGSRDLTIKNAKHPHQDLGQRKKTELATSLVGLFVEEAVRSRLSSYIHKRTGKAMSRTFNYPKNQKSDEIYEGRDDLYKQIYIHQLHEKFRLKHSKNQMSLIPARHKINDPFRSTSMRGFMSSENLLGENEPGQYDMKQTEPSHKEYSSKYQTNPEIVIPHIQLPGSSPEAADAKRGSGNAPRRIIASQGASKESLRYQLNKGFSVTAQTSPHRNNNNPTKGGLLVPENQNQRGNAPNGILSGTRPGWRSPALVGWLPPGQSTREHELSNSGISLRDISNSNHKQVTL